MVIFKKANSIFFLNLSQNLQIKGSCINLFFLYSVLLFWISGRKSHKVKTSLHGNQLADFPQSLNLFCYMK